jgi:hypothetical protein
MSEMAMLQQSKKARHNDAECYHYEYGVNGGNHQTARRHMPEPFPTIERRQEKQNDTPEPFAVFR